MIIQPTHHWQFAEREGSNSVDSVGAVNATFHKAIFNQCGAIGDAVLLKESGSSINLGKEIGQLGTSDFTIAFGMLILDTHGQKDMDIIGNRNVSGHGNWFSLRQEHGQILMFEVDENNKGKNYAVAKTAKVMVAKKWFHIAIVRKGAELKVYHNGLEVAKGTAKNGGVANINSNVDVKLGHHIRQTSKARYEDLRIYHEALTASQIEGLAAPHNQLLQPGEIELTAIDGAKRIFNKEHSDLRAFSTQFTTLRVGPDTGVTLYDGKTFSGTRQKLFVGLPETRSTRLQGFPQSVLIWPSAGEPFRGQWVIKAPRGGYLGWRNGQLLTKPKCSERELFRFIYNQNNGQVQLVSQLEHHGALIKLDDEYSAMIVDYTENGKGTFSIMHKRHTRWIAQDEDGNFSWTADTGKRAIFTCIAKFAANEDEVGELVTGEVALYQQTAYKGKAWILSDNDDDIAGDFKALQEFFGLDNTTSSVRLGPNTGVTLFANPNQKINDGKRETDVEDIVDHIPSLIESQIGNDNLSSLKVFTKVVASDAFSSISSKLSQDYRMVDGELQEFSAYRTILTLIPEVTELEVSATDLTKIEVEDETYVIDELTSIKLKPNMLNQVMITSEADGLNSPILKFRTQDMAENERILISPADELQQQIANLEQDAIYNGKDAKGKPIVDHSKHTQSEVASVQNTIKRVVSSLEPTASVKTEKPAATASQNSVSVNLTRSLASNSLVSTTKANRQPWAINFTAKDSGATVVAGPTKKLKTLNKQDEIWEETISQQDFDSLFARTSQPQALVKVAVPSLVSSSSNLRFARGFIGSVGDAIKGATKVTFGFVNDVLNAVVEVAGDVISFVLDAVEVVAQFVQAVVEKVVESIKQFIEFLRFLFDWDDILQTQRYIKNSINNAFDSAAGLVESAKGPVSNLIDDIQDTVTSSIDGLIKTLGVDPSEVANDDSALPEAAEWFLNKIFSSVGPGKSPMQSLTSNSSASAGSASNNMTNALSKLAEMAAITLTEGFIGTIQTFIENPSRPELVLATLLELVKDITVQALDITEDLIMAILDAVVAAIHMIKDTLNAELNIPFISALFELIGAGKLSIMNLLTILVAIPTTVVSKLMFGERPFKDVGVPSLIESEASLVAINNENVATASQLVANNKEEVKQLVQSFGALKLHTEIFSGLFNAALDSVPEPVDFQGRNGTFVVEIFTVGLDWMSWLGSFPASPNNPGGFPYLVHKHQVSKNDNPVEYWQRVVWGYRTALLALDTVFLVMGVAKKGSIPKGVNTTGLDKIARLLPVPQSEIGKDSSFPQQRLKRGNVATIGVQMGLSAVDLVLTSIYLAQIPKKDKPGLEAANEMITILPNMLGLLRLDSSGVGSLTLGGIQLVKTVANYGMGVELLGRTVKNL